MDKVTQVTIEEVIDAIYDASVIVRIRKYGIAPPDGFALVPTEPTLKMKQAGGDLFDGNSFYWATKCYKAMLNAAKDKP